MNRTSPNGRGRMWRTYALNRPSRTDHKNRTASPSQTVQEKGTGHGAANDGQTKSLLSRQIRPPPRTDHRLPLSVFIRIAEARCCSFQICPLGAHKAGEPDPTEGNPQPGSNSRLRCGNIARSPIDGQEIRVRKTPFMVGSIRSVAAHMYMGGHGQGSECHIGQRCDLPPHPPSVIAKAANALHAAQEHDRDDAPTRDHGSQAPDWFRVRD